jgi:serine/threonine protein kinase
VGAVCYYYQRNPVKNEESDLGYYELSEIKAKPPEQERKTAEDAWTRLQVLLSVQKVQTQRREQDAVAAKQYELAEQMKEHLEHLDRLERQGSKLRQNSDSSIESQKRLQHEVEGLCIAAASGPRVRRSSLSPSEMDRMHIEPYDSQTDIPFALGLKKTLTIDGSSSSEELSDYGRRVLYSVRILRGLSDKFFDGRWKLQKIIGAGGTGTVVLARDKLLKQPVALKVVLPSGAVPTFGQEEQKRFERESIAMQRVQHPSIVHYYENHYDESKRIYFVVMEHCPGRSLEDVLNSDGPLAYHKLVEVAISLVGGLQELHSKNIIHLDLKPANIILDEDDSGVSIKLVDFGLARAPSGASRKVSVDMSVMMTHTKNQSVAGTLMFMPLEQLKSQSLDFRTDIFGAGVTLYRLGCKKFPHRDECKSLGDALSEVASWANTPPQSLEQQNPSIQAKFAQIVAKAISLQPGDRFSSAHAMLTALQALQEMNVVISSPGSSLQGENVMEFVQQACAVRKDIAFGYDWEGSSSADARDSERIDWSDGNSVKQSYWFKGYRESVKGQVKLLCQTHTGRIVLICIEGGPISQLEATEIRDTLVSEVKSDMESKTATLDIIVKPVTFEDFKQEMGGKVSRQQNQSLMEDLVSSHGSVSGKSAAAN